MRKLTRSDFAFDVGSYPLKHVVAISENGAVLAHINANFGGVKTADEFIKAINNHDELVSALRNLLIAEFGPKFKTHPQVLDSGLWTRARDIVVKVESC